MNDPEVMQMIFRWAKLKGAKNQKEVMKMALAEKFYDYKWKDKKKMYFITDYAREYFAKLVENDRFYR